MKGRDAKGDEKAGRLAEFGVYVDPEDKPNAQSFYVQARDYLKAGAFLMDAVEAERLKLRSPDVIDQSLAHAAELAFKAHLLALDPDFKPHEAKHGILRLFDRIERSDEAITAGPGMREAMRKLADGTSNGSADPSPRRQEPTQDPSDTDSPVDVRGLVDHYDRHLGYYGSLYRYPVARFVSGSPPVFRRNPNGGNSLVDVGRFAFRHWVAAYLTALYTTIFPKEPTGETNPT